MLEALLFFYYSTEIALTVGPLISVTATPAEVLKLLSANWLSQFRDLLRLL
jgi:hypothetical protein